MEYTHLCIPSSTGNKMCVLRREEVNENLNYSILTWEASRQLLFTHKIHLGWIITSESKSPTRGRLKPGISHHQKHPEG